MSPSDDPASHSAGSDDSDGEQNQETFPQNAKKPRSSRACVACRRMKTRCEIDEALGSACKLCIRARRQCIMQTLPRRRKRKTTERVADLERKINTLTALLASNEPPNSVDPSPSSGGEGAPSRSKDQDPEETADDSQTLIAKALSRGLLDWPTACKAFDRYREEMCIYFPFVVFPATADATLVKEQQPLLFFAICTVALPTMRGPVNLELRDMLTRDLALRIMYRAERSLELVQVLLIHITWYTRGKEMRELNFNQMGHVACAMGLDIGLGRRSHKSAQSDDPHQLESLAGRRAWLGCYYLVTNIAMSLRHPASVRWSVYIEECLDVLSCAPSALPSDRWLCDLIRIQHIAEDASMVFSMDDPGSVISFRDVKTQYHIRSFHQQLEQWRRNAHNSSNHLQAFARHIEAATALYVNEVAIHSEHNIDELRLPPRPTAANDALSNEDIGTTSTYSQFAPARIECLFTCLSAIHHCFDALLSMDISTLVTLPNFFLVRTGYAARALRKLLNICEHQGAVTGQFPINSKDLKFEEYMTSIIRLLARIHEETNSQVARAFYLVITQIKQHGIKSHHFSLFANCPAMLPRIDTELDKEGFRDSGIALNSTGRLGVATTVGAASGEQLHSVSQASYAIPDAPAQIPLEQQNPSWFDSSAAAGSLPSWQEAGTFDAGMSYLQWFEQDFPFDDLEMYGMEDMSYIP
ncbi:hypothetical protein PV08_03616 [Exophiala spinifera]|uniref:Zn(2)-C6 fungal-type domain-containing protein n=1 Tax=Exophiala spinifera TaxID=91928 RepID=A0A0D2A332_9EURO|nr:uncharacterized protein PV08_03616 [Exophiala spinifera]KIW19322.1 hypothetical protein PV08_03616 [Exophiala spinifera]